MAGKDDMIITKKMLIEKKACIEGLEWWCETFGDEMEVTLENMQKFDEPSYIDWLVDNFLTAPAWKVYRETTATADGAYKEAMATVRKVYQEAIAPAFVEAVKLMEAADE